MPGPVTRSAPVRALTGLLRRLRLLRAPALPACGLGLDDLPHGLGQLPVGTPVALAWQGRAPDLIWAHALLQDLLRQGPVFVLAENEERADALLLPEVLALARQQGRLTIWLMSEGLRRATQPVGMAALLGELQQAGLTPAHALLVLASPQAQFGPTVAGVQQWGRQIGNWCRSRARPVVFGFDGWDSAELVLGPLRSLPAVFEHVAVLGSQPQGPVLFVDRWNGSEGPLFELRLGIQCKADNRRLAYDGSQMRGPAQRLVEAPDQYQVLATRAAVVAQRGVPAAWTVVDDLADVLPATQGAIAATVLLHAGSMQQQEALLELVFALRCRHGRVLKIVVHETQDKLRSNLEQALLALGANRVVYREVGFARLLRLLEEMCDETYSRPIGNDYAATRAGFMPDALRGYLPLPAFCDSVQAMLARTSQMGLKHCFLRLSMQPHAAHVDAIQACLALRDGDVLSADQDALYVFMFACSEADIEPALERLFSIAPSELFAAQTLYGSTDGVHAVLRDLREAARKGVPDYSSYRNARPAIGARVIPVGPPPGAVLHVPLVAPPALPAEPDASEAPAPHVPQTPTVRARPLARRNAYAKPGDNHAD